jgi:Restriction endonuclease AspBHI N-terminal
VLCKLIPGAGNQGGFRQVGPWDAPQMVVLYSSMDDPDWPDFIDVYTGVFTYFGDFWDTRHTKNCEAISTR